MIMDASLVFLDADYQNQDDLFHKMAAWLEKHGYVNEQYQSALRQREEQFPTGLRIPGHQLAIPHTDSEFIKKPGLVFVRPSRPLQFLEMCTGSPVEAEMIFMLLVKNKQDQMPLLSGLMSRFSDAGLMDRLSQEKDPEVIARLLDTCTGSH